MKPCSVSVRRRAFALLLVVIMALSLTTPVFAYEINAGEEFPFSPISNECGNDDCTLTDYNCLFVENTFLVSENLDESGASEDLISSFALNNGETTWSYPTVKSDITGNGKPDPIEGVLVATTDETALWRLEYEGGYLEAFYLEGYPDGSGRHRWKLVATPKDGFGFDAVPIQTKSSETGTWGTSALTNATRQIESIATSADGISVTAQNTENVGATASRWFRANFVANLWDGSEYDWEADNGDTLEDFAIMENNGELKIVAYFGVGGNVEIPDGINITEIGDNAFRRNFSNGGFGVNSDVSITSIKFPDSLISIGPRAFQDVDLNGGALALPSLLVTVGNECFAGTSISGNLEIPASVTTLGSGAFSDTDIESVVFLAGASELTIASNAFSNSASLESIQGTRNINWDGMYFALAPNLHTIDLPNMRGIIGTLGFSPMLTKIVIPDGVTGIRGSYDAGVFEGTNIKEVIFPNNTTNFSFSILGGSRFNRPDSQLEYAALLSSEITTGLDDAFTQRTSSVGEGDTYPGEKKFQSVYVYPGTTTSATALAANSLGLDKVSYLTRTIKATVQDSSAIGFNFSNEVTVEWDDYNGVGEDIFPSFEPTVLDAWARVNAEHNGSTLPEFAAFVLNGIRYTKTQAGETALPNDAELHFIPQGMTSAWFVYEGEEKQTIELAPEIDVVLTLMSDAGVVKNMPLYKVDADNLTDSGYKTDEQGQVMLNLAAGTYILTPYDIENNKIVFSFLTVDVARESRLGSLSGVGAPEFGSEKVIGTDFAAGSLTNVGELTATGFDAKCYEYDYYADKNTTAVTFTINPQLSTIASSMRLSVSGTSVDTAEPVDGMWKVTIPLSDLVTPVKLVIYDIETTKSTEYTVNIIRALTWNGTDKTINIADSQDMAMLSKAVANGETFAGTTLKLTNDITLPVDWIPLGGGETSTNPVITGRQVIPFSGTIDGAKPNGNGNYTITYEAGARPLLKFARGATVQNLNIAGVDINGHGLLESYFVDYGPTGSYTAWEKAGIGTLEVINFTILSGTNIRGSGVTGAFASGINYINITNSVVEQGVKIGWNAESDQSSGSSDVGSFVGSFSGTITDSVSYADVYGVNNVGGLAGSKSQSMGPCVVRNSSFGGTIYANGDWVGGILGSGYNAGSAPNTPAASIENSFVTGTVNGNNYVGGIFGGEGGVLQCWDNGIGYIRNNHFAGTINSSGQYVGGIIGYMRSLNLYNVISNNYYLADKATIGIGGVGRIETLHPSPADNASVQYSQLGYPRNDDPLDKNADDLTRSVTADEMSNKVSDWLNAGEGSLANWNGEGSHPVHDTSIVTVSSITLGGNYKTQYYVGDAVDYSNLGIIVSYSDGNTEQLTSSNSGVAITGLDTSEQGEKTVTVSYKGVRATYTVFVLPRVPTGNVTPSADTIDVTFKIVGSTKSSQDVDLTGNNPDGYYGAKYTIWLEDSFTLEKGASMYELFMMAIQGTGITSVGAEKNYIETITSKTGNRMSEFTNGPYSGWMYTVNKLHPNLGILEYKLTESCEVVWHYVNDYRYEVEDWFDELKYPALGNGTLHNLWREAKEFDAPNNPNTSTTGGNTTVVPDVSETIAVTATTANGVANAIVPTDDVKAKITALIGAAKNSDDLLEILIDIQTSSNATSLNTHLDRDVIKAIAETNNIQLTITSALGDMTFDNATIKGILSRTTTPDAKIVITIAQADKSGLNDDVLEAIKDNKVFTLSITIDGTDIHDFNGTVTAFIPYNLNSRDAKTLTVSYVNEKGETTAMTNVRYVTKDGVGGFEFTTTHFSLFMIAPLANTGDWTNPFSDVKESDWFYDAVKYVHENGLMVGGGNGKFDPGAPLTRAMLVQVLYNNENRTATTAANPFTDVAAGLWYTDAIVWAADNGIISGYGNGLFGPNDNITREQVVLILNNYAKWKQLDVSATTDLAKYTDAGNISDWALAAMKWGNATELMSGRTTTTLVPQGETTRAEIATLLMRFIENILK